MIAATIERLAREDLAAVAVSCRNVETTYTELHERGARLAGGLRTLAGQRVGVMVEDFIRQLACLLALDRLRSEAVLSAAHGALSDLKPAAVLSDDLLLPAEPGPEEGPALAAGTEGKVVLFTSGTSGPPEPVVHTWNSLAGAVETADRYRRRRWLLTYNQSGFAALQVVGKRLGRPRTAAKNAGQIGELHRAGVSKAEIARRLHIGRTSMRRILGGKEV